ncbi:MAG: thiamine pyrophosphate-dependent dehydrogenase E1 component subunit alpha [Gammaproteobacteria bacterium]|nr:thiamine pyrophosphate-dependent dehydrogenase E1 component subunit alpha [Gammaproteobacteria bacterium]
MKIGKDVLLRAYRTMKTIREFETRVAKEFEAGRVPGFTHLYTGQEAIATGICAHLTDADAISSTHRGHGHCIAKGCDVRQMMLELYCKRDGLCKGKGGSMHIADLRKGMLGANAIVGAGAPLAGGAALAAKTLGTTNVAVAFCGDGATNQGTVLETLNFAVVLKLPLIFAVENNGYGEHTGIDYHLGCGDISARMAAFGMPAVKVDGTDFFAVYEATAAAVKRARAGEGPSAIECLAPRWRGHFEGDPQSYRNLDEIGRLREEKDCLKNFRAAVTRHKRVPAGELDAIDSEVAKLIDNSVAEAIAAAPPEPAHLTTDVYVTY